MYICILYKYINIYIYVYIYQWKRNFMLIRLLFKRTMPFYFSRYEVLRDCHLRHYFS